MSVRDEHVPANFALRNRTSTEGTPAIHVPREPITSLPMPRGSCCHIYLYGIPNGGRQPSVALGATARRLGDMAQLIIGNSLTGAWRRAVMALLEAPQHEI